MKDTKMRRKAQVWIMNISDDASEVEGKRPVLRCLLLQTNTKRGEFWQPVTGSVEEGESFAEGALREAQEETGFEFSSPLWDTGYSFEFASRFGPAQECVFVTLVEAQNEPRLDPKEHQAFQWVSLDEAQKFLTFETNLSGLKHATQEIKKHHSVTSNFKATLVAFLLFGLASFLTPLRGLAAQNGRIIHDGASIRAEADIKSSILEVRRRGEELRISSEAKDGWFKTRTLDGHLGWIHQAEVMPREFDTVLRHGDLQEDLLDHPDNYRAHREKGIYAITFRAAGGFNSMMAPPLNLRFDKPFYRSNFAPLGMAQINLHFNDSISLALRSEFHQSKWHILAFDIEHQAVPLLLGLEFTLHMNLRQRTYLGALAGVGVNDHIAVTSTDFSGPGNGGQISANPLYAMLTLGHERRVASWLGFFAELELRAGQSFATPSTGSFFGAETAFRQDGSDVGMSIANHGLAALLGLELIF